MSTNIIQTSFASGELSPSLFARVDLTKYHSGAALMRNWFVDYRSGASTRPGTKFVCQAFKSGTPVRLIPFQSSALVPYTLEFGDKYIRFHSFGAPVLEAGFAITGASQANPCVLTITGNNYAIGDWIFVTGIVGMTQLNGRFFKVTNVAGAAVTIATVNGTPINSLSFTAYSSGGSAGRVYTLVSPYAAADLALLKFVQQTNTMYITHPAYGPSTLVINSPTNWAITIITFGTTISPPTSVTAAPSSAGAANYSYIGTSVDAFGQESLPSVPGAVGSAVNISATAGTIAISWISAAGAVAYNIYKAEPSVFGAVPAGVAYGFIGSATANNFVDSNIVPDFSTTPEIVGNPFTLGNNPGTCAFFQQRLYLAGSNSFPQTFWASQPGYYTNFNFSNPIQPNDAYNDTLVSKQVNFIKNMVSMPGGLIFLTSTGAWQLSSGSGVASTAAVTPINATATPQAYNGATDLPPIVCNFDVLYAQIDGTIRDLSYNIYAAIYTGTDISVLSNHLFFGYNIKEWAFAELPFKLIWAVRNDGTLLSLTFVKEQEIVGWAAHTTNGLYQSVSTVIENQYNAVYVVVKRFIGGQWVQMIERMDDRISFPYGAEDSWSVDCGVRSTLPTPAADITADISTVGPQVTFRFSANVLTGPETGWIIRMNGGIAVITSPALPTVALGTWLQAPLTVPEDPNNTPLPATAGTWSLTAPSTVFSGLDYLEGQLVSILADGSAVTPQVVLAGQITLPQPATKVVAGLKFTPKLQTMPLDLGNEKDTVQAKRKKISALSVRVNNARGLSAGPRFDMLTPIKEMNPSVPMGSAIPLVNRDERLIMQALWSVEGQICIQQDNPFPATVLGVIPEITIGDTAGGKPQ